MPKYTIYVPLTCQANPPKGQVPTMVAVKNITRALCTTPICLRLANDFVKNLSPQYKSIDPCTNFEEMVCGGWRLRHEIPASQMAIDAIGLIREENEEVLHAILEGPYPGDLSRNPPSTDKENFETMKLAYTTCMDEDGLRKLGVTPMTKLLDELDGAFGSEDWSQSLVFANLVGATSLVSMYVAPDLDSPEKQVVYLNSEVGSGAGLSLPNRDFYTNTSMLMNEYVPIVANILQAVLPGNLSADSAQQARDLVRFEADLAAISPPASAGFYDVATRASFSEADALAPRLGLSKVYTAFAPPDIPPVDLLWNRAYIGNLSQLLDATSRSAIEGYITWRVILATQSLVLSDDHNIFEPFNALRNRLQGIVTTETAPPPRWRTCLASVLANLGWILSRFFTERSFSQRDWDLANQVISDVRTAYVHKLNTVSWLDEPTRAKAIEKIHLLVQKVGYPTANPNLTDPESLRVYYAPVDITSSHFDNTRQARASAMRRNFQQQLGKPTDRTSWGDFYAVIANAYYAPDTNEVAFPAGILQLPIFGGEDLPSAVKYGAFGALAGHEVSHGFDKIGMHFDGTGRLVDWWSDGVLDEYKKRERCFVEQFANMTVYANDKNASGRGYPVDGLRTVGENEADSAGLVAAYDAWVLRRELDGNKTGLGLPGLTEWTDEQLFFLAFGNIWCGVISDDGLKLELRQAGHAPNWGRIMGSTANSRGFREAFGCEVKEPVCTLW